MSATQPNVISIAGFDPSGGAGILADIKTFQPLGVYGFGACTSITVQNEETFRSVHWLSFSEIEHQLEIILKKHPVRWTKIGLIENFEVLKQVLDLLERNGIKVIWDPILKASAGFSFHHKIHRDDLQDICKKIFLVTPNREEITHLTGTGQPEEGAGIAAGYGCSVLLKGGHCAENANDILLHKGRQYIFEGEQFQGYEKHGSGCVLSSAILAALAKGSDLISACADAKEYMRKFLLSTDQLLGIHDTTEEIKI